MERTLSASIIGRPPEDGDGISFRLFTLSECTTLNPLWPLALNHILLVFIDGIGLGPPGDFNPFSFLSLPGFELLSGGNSFDDESPELNGAKHIYRHIDAGLGVPGLPQSGTGQASLFTGINCAEAAGRHFGPFPHSSSRPILASYNVFSQVKSLGLDVAFANAFPPIFFKHAHKRNRWSVTTRSCLESDTRIRNLDDLEKGQAVAADITGQRLVDHLGLKINVSSETEAAVNLADLSSRNAFTAFEYFHTDKAGHARSHEEAEKCLVSLSSFLVQLVAESFNRTLTLVLTSDHGNLENLAIKTHTENPVPFVAFGELAPSFYGVRSLVDIVPGVIDALSS